MSIGSSAFILDFKCPEQILMEPSACTVNAVSFLMKQVGKQVPIKELANSMGWSRSGVTMEAHVYQKLNKQFRSTGTPLSLQWSLWKTHEELARELSLSNTGIPVMFHLDVLHFIKKYVELEGKSFDFGHVFDDPNKHVLILVGYDWDKKELYFVDPVYHLCFYKPDTIKKNLAILSLKDFGQATSAGLRNFIKVKKESLKIPVRGRQTKLK